MFIYDYSLHCRIVGFGFWTKNVNYSNHDFVIKDRSYEGENSAILYSLSAVKNVGSGPIQAIEATREEDGPFNAMRSMFAPYVEQFTLVAREDADINSFKDLKGKRVYMGPPGSGKRETMNVIMEAFGWSRDDVEEIPELKASSASEALCDNEMDAFVYTVGHPSPEVREAVATCRAVVAPVSGRAMEKLVNRSPIYVSTVIPGGIYKGHLGDIPTVGVVATLVTTDKTNPEVVYQVTKAFFENLDRLREATPLFSSLSSRDMVSKGQTAPLHDGASRYFTEAGLQ